MRAIPKKLLIHNATIKTLTGEKDRWGAETYTDPIDLKYIRIEPSSKLVKDKQNNELQLSALMFFDIKNSQPAGTEFVQEQIIDWNGKEYRIQIIDTLYDDQNLHHYELGLI